ncbi:hypothetical protein HAX54_023707, partial [Datura stramonium]|nr:hypothetical protein [Datura stramonium]
DRSLKRRIGTLCYQPREAPAAWAHWQAQGAIILVHFQAQRDNKIGTRLGARRHSSGATAGARRPALQRIGMCEAAFSQHNGESDVSQLRGVGIGDAASMSHDQN